MSEFIRVINSQLFLNRNNRRPLNHYLCGTEELMARAIKMVLEELPRKGYTLLPEKTHSVEARDLRRQGNDFFTSLYEGIDDLDMEAEEALMVVQPVVVPDISPCYIGHVLSGQPANHLFLQVPLEPTPNHPSTIETILSDRPKLPRVVVLHHLGYLAGEAAFGAGFLDITISHFHDGVWTEAEIMSAND